MDSALSTHLFVNQRLTSVWLDRVWDAGIPQVEIFCARQHLDYRDPAQIRELGHWFRDSPLRVHSLHAPLFSDDCWGRTGPHSVITITEAVKSRRVEMVDEIKRAIEIAEEIPFRYLIQHLGAAGEEFAEGKLDAAFNSLEELSIFARQRGVEILLENTPNGLSSAERLLHFLEITHLRLGLCFDTGHANLAASVESEYALMKDHIRSTHIHDNDGSADQHLLPGTPGGTIDWTKAMAALRSRPSQYPLVLELFDDSELPKPFAAVRETFSRLLSLS
jgi:sugar phosphate isomerase/epimerase